MRPEPTARNLAAANLARTGRNNFDGCLARLRPSRRRTLAGLDCRAFDRHREADEYLFGIGPEGGFTDEEVAAAQAAGWRSIDLGPRILRVETAAILLAACVMLRPASLERFSSTEGCHGPRFRGHAFLKQHAHGEREHGTQRPWHTP